MNALIVIVMTFAAIFLSIVAVSVIALAIRDKKRKGKVKNHKRTAAALCCCGAVIFAGVIWFFLPFRMVSAKPESVKFIEIFDGSTGEAYTISNDEEIRQIMENFHSVKLVRKKVEWRSGYSLRVAVNYRSGRTAVYLVNSEHDVVTGPFICETAEGEIDYDHLCSLVG